MTNDNRRLYKLEPFVRFIKHHLNCYPEEYRSVLYAKATFQSFTLIAADLTNTYDRLFDEKIVKVLIDTIYLFQISKGCHTGQYDPQELDYGFRGTFMHCLGVNDCQKSINVEAVKYDTSHLAQTYSSLCCLISLGDDLSRVDKANILINVGKCQNTNGSFRVSIHEDDYDLRMTFCAISICYILDDFSTISVPKACAFIMSCYSFQGGFAQQPNNEAHGGSTYCAVASLILMGKLDDTAMCPGLNKQRLITWALMLQKEGFSGRANKEEDSCYSFWVGGTLEMLGASKYIDYNKLHNYLTDCAFGSHGGFSKQPGLNPDILHTYFSIAALSIMSQNDQSNNYEPKDEAAITFAPLFVPLNISKKAYEHLLKIQQRLFGKGFIAATANDDEDSAENTIDDNLGNGGLDYSNEVMVPSTSDTSTFSTQTPENILIIFIFLFGGLLVCLLISICLFCYCKLSTTGDKLNNPNGILSNETCRHDANCSEIEHSLCLERPLTPRAESFRRNSAQAHYRLLIQSKFDQEYGYYRPPFGDSEETCNELKPPEDTRLKRILSVPHI
uniref:Protein geranylgeranyltransferase type I n=1 Tax=Rhabditophanes sp. KR3021 TaxID=114890 RepID=A0AC35U775_9BILA